MDEGRKRTILIAASILVARDYAQLKGKETEAIVQTVGFVAAGITVLWMSFRPKKGRR